MPDLDDRVKQNTDDIRDVRKEVRDVSGEVAELRVNNGRMYERVNALQKTTETGLNDIKSTLKTSRTDADKYREKKEEEENELKTAVLEVKAALAADDNDEEERRKWGQWARDNIDGKTIILVLAVIVAIWSPTAFNQVKSLFIPVISSTVEPATAEQLPPESNP